MVEGDADALGEVLAEQGDFGVTLTEMVQHDEAGVHLHAHADGLRRGAAGETTNSQQRPAAGGNGGRGGPALPVPLVQGLLLQTVLQRGLVDQQRRLFACKHQQP